MPQSSSVNQDHDVTRNSRLLDQSYNNEFPEPEHLHSICATIEGRDWGHLDSRESPETIYEYYHG